MDTDESMIPPRCRQNLAVVGLSTALRRYTKGRPLTSVELDECLKEFQKCFPDVDMSEVWAQVGEDFAQRNVSDQVRILSGLLGAHADRHLSAQI